MKTLCNFNPMAPLGLAAFGLAGTLSLAGALALAGCVTINIYFPAAAAEKAADRIIDEVYDARADGATVRTLPAPANAAPAKQ